MSNLSPVVMETNGWRSISSSTHCLDYTMRFKEMPAHVELSSCLLAMVKVAGERCPFRITCNGCNRFSSRNEYFQCYEEQFFGWLCSRDAAFSPCCVQNMAESFTQVHAYVVANHRCKLKAAMPSNVAHTFVIHLEISDIPSVYSRVVMESFEEVGPITKPASRAILRILLKNEEEKEERGTDIECVICMDEIQTLKSSLNMPCSHIFHKDCLVTWLKTSHVCPLCRYELPTEESTEECCDIAN